MILPPLVFPGPTVLWLSVLIYTQAHAHEVGLCKDSLQGQKLPIKHLILSFQFLSDSSLVSQS